MADTTIDERIIYTKESLTYEKQLELLRQRGMTISDDEKALSFLEYKSYYRLSGYWYTMLENKSEHTFQKNSEFDTAIEYYNFDKFLRKILLNEIEKIEIALKAKMTYFLCHKLGVNWQNEIQHFDEKYHSKFEKLRNDMLDNFRKSKDIFAIEYNRKYKNNPPSWIEFETASFGSISLLFKYLDRKNKNMVANHFRLDGEVMSSWIHFLVSVRNICAHHSRVWNRIFSIVPIKLRNNYPRWLETTDLSNKTVYYLLAVIHYFLSKIDPSTNIMSQVKNLVEHFPNVKFSSMGFPEGWENDYYWI